MKKYNQKKQSKNLNERRSVRLCLKSIILKNSVVSFVTVMMAGVFGVIGGGIVVGSNASALTYQDAVDLRFTWNPTINISLSSANLVIDNLTPGTSADSNIITINVTTNNASGYTLTATTGNTTNASTNLVNSVDSTKLFSSLATDADLAALTTDNTWGYSFSTDSGTNWSNYSGLPLYTATSGAQLVNNDGSGSTSVQFKIAAKASAEQASGAYTNVINFTTVANPIPGPEPIPCAANKICYSSNALDSEGTMGIQSTSSNTDVTLLASNFSRTGYGFAGWSPTMDGTGMRYGPNETINTGDLSSTGLSLYAIWVPSAGTIQNWTGCPDLIKGRVTALTDSRDNNTYAVAKLADGKCWMIENLRLDNTATGNSDGSLAQGYSSSFTGLAEPETTNFGNSTAANTIYSIDGSTEKTISGNFQGYRFPRYNNINTSARADAPTLARNKIFGYGNYYTWAATIADTEYYSSGDHGTTSICPSGWRLPIGDQSTADKSFGALSVALGGPESGASAGSNSTPTGTVMSITFRSYPNNFIYSGYINEGVISNRGSSGHYWSSTAKDSVMTYDLNFSNNNVNSGTGYYSKYDGQSIRCLADS